MRILVKLLLLLMTVIAINSCDSIDPAPDYLNSIDTYTYYSEEIIPDKFMTLYGTWKLYAISGGFHGQGHEPDFNSMIIKSIGIYGLVRNDTIFEHGQIVVDSNQAQNEEFLKINTITKYHKDSNPYLNPSQWFVHLRNDTLHLMADCCDFYNYHFTKSKN